MNGAGNIDAHAFRRHFPGLDNRVYLASCSLGAASTRMAEAMAAMLAAMHGRRSPWESFETEVDRLRSGAAALIGARADQVALVPNASTGAFQVASSLSWRRRPQLVATPAEFPSLAHVWLAQASRGAQVRFAGSRDAVACGADVLGAVDGRTGLVSVPMTTYRDGVRLPVARIAAAAHAAGAQVFVDAYQAAGVEPVDVTTLDCDFLVTGFGKYLLGLPGVVVLYVRRPAAGPHQPQLTGWQGRRDPFAFNPYVVDFPDEARRFETGTPAVPALYAANAGLSLIGELDLAAVRRHVSGLVAHAAAILSAQGHQVSAAADPASRGAHVAVPHRDPTALAGWMAERGVVISPRGRVARLSVHAYTTRGDVEAACALIDQFEGPRRLTAVPAR